MITYFWGVNVEGDWLAISFRCRWLVVWSRQHKWLLQQQMVFPAVLSCFWCCALRVATVPFHIGMLLAVWFCLHWMTAPWWSNSIFRWSFLLLGWLFKRFLFSVWEAGQTNIYYCGTFNGLTGVWECWIMVNAVYTLVRPIAYEFDVIDTW